MNIHFGQQSNLITAIILLAVVILMWRRRLRAHHVLRDLCADVLERRRILEGMSGLICSTPPPDDAPAIPEAFRSATVRLAATWADVSKVPLDEPVRFARSPVPRWPLDLFAVRFPDGSIVSLKGYYEHRVLHNAHHLFLSPMVASKARDIYNQMRRPDVFGHPTIGDFIIKIEDLSQRLGSDKVPARCSGGGMPLQKGR